MQLIYKMDISRHTPHTYALVDRVAGAQLTAPATLS